jgi:3-(3-hydroxy-phenyl)propionate hydroxylase
VAIEERVFIAGAGPVGLSAAANLVHAGVPVTVLEAGSGLSEESRASTFHPPTLDMLDALGAAKPLIAQGLIAPSFQYRSKRHGILAQFDFGAIADATGHPYRVQSEQFRLTRILHDRLRGEALFALEFNSRVQGVVEHETHIEIVVESNGRSLMRTGRWLIGADGARSDVRRALGIAFEGFTWPERFLVVSTPFDFAAVMPGLACVSYVADPLRWHFLLRIPGLYRVMFPIAADESDARALDPDFAQALLASVAPLPSLPGKRGRGRVGAKFEVAHVTLYNVHQRVAQTFRRDRVLLAGDAAHINNPLGGMGMNGGIHDAINLTARLAQVWHGRKRANELDRYDRQRRQVTLEHIEKQSIQNKRNLESDGTEFGQRLRHIAADPERTREYLLQVSMISSLRRAAELG